MTPLSVAQRKLIAKEARALAASLDDIQLLSIDELALLDAAELDDYFLMLGVKIDWELIEAQVRAEFGEEGLALDRAAKLDQAAAERLDNARQRAEIAVAKSVARQTIREVEQAALEKGDARPDAERYSVWVTVEDKRRCPDCYDRHGLVDSQDAWDLYGPGLGTTICGSNCRCRLIPAKITAREAEGIRLEEMRVGMAKRA